MRHYLTTERLTLREFTADDEDLVVGLDGDPEVMRYLTGGRPTPRATIRDEIIPYWLGYYERTPGFGYWAAEESATGEFLGWFHFRPPRGAGPDEAELGYRLRRAAWGRGFATEGAQALVRRGFEELGVRRICAFTMAVNLGSRRVMEKSGLRLVGTVHEDWPDPIPGSEHGEVEYALTRDEWRR